MSERRAVLAARLASDADGIWCECPVCGLEAPVRGDKLADHYADRSADRFHPDRPDTFCRGSRRFAVDSDVTITIEEQP